jgi:SAM-dependent methyltransferase/uncharacterized protein YbaR (Trm112 family)
VWVRLTELLCCPLCRNSLKLVSFDETSISISAEHLILAESRGLLASDVTRWVETGLLICQRCDIWFPIWRGLPVLLTFPTEVRRRFCADFHKELSGLGSGCKAPDVPPMPGEQFVMNSFSEEWLHYDYDGVLWTANYQDLEDVFLSEVNAGSSFDSGSSFLEIGCGLGITTSIAQKHYRGDSVGIDLSLAALRACEQWKSNPFLHFIQASVFRLPFPERAFDVVYSRGVLHHTYSVQEAFTAAASRCRTGGHCYLWVYGRASIDSNWFRRAAFKAEMLLRPIFSERPTSFLARTSLGCIATAYMIFNRSQRWRNPTLQRYTFSRALHAARDRFTPKYAHRHSHKEVCAWFQAAGFENIATVDWRTMPAVEQPNYRRNVGVRGQKTTRGLNP